MYSAVEKKIFKNLVSAKQAINTTETCHKIDLFLFPHLEVRRQYASYFPNRFLPQLIRK